MSTNTLLVLSLFCFTIPYSLTKQCYSCFNCFNETQQIKNCSKPDDICWTFVATFRDQIVLLKGCTIPGICENTFYNDTGIQYYGHCCNDDLCNKEVIKNKNATIILISNANNHKFNILLLLLFYLYSF
jgi:hypothetical protein